MLGMKASQEDLVGRRGRVRAGRPVAAVVVALAMAAALVSPATAAPGGKGGAAGGGTQASLTVTYRATQSSTTEMCDLEATVTATGIKKDATLWIGTTDGEELAGDLLSKADNGVANELVIAVAVADGTEVELEARLTSGRKVLATSGLETVTISCLLAFEFKLFDMVPSDDHWGENFCDFDVRFIIREFPDGPESFGVRLRTPMHSGTGWWVGPDGSNVLTADQAGEWILWWDKARPRGPKGSTWTYYLELFEDQAPGEPTLATSNLITIVSDC